MSRREVYGEIGLNDVRHVIVRLIGRLGQQNVERCGEHPAPAFAEE
jgi:hypothetical protein